MLLILDSFSIIIRAVWKSFEYGNYSEKYFGYLNLNLKYIYESIYL